MTSPAVSTRSPRDANGTLYAGGQFINMAGIPAADHVAAFNGTWHAMGSGPSTGGGAVDDYVRSLASSGNDVYIGTDSLNVAGIAQADHVAKWNGSAWSALGCEHRRRRRLVPDLGVHLRARCEGLAGRRDRLVPERERRSPPPT